MNGQDRNYFGGAGATQSHGTAQKVLNWRLNTLRVKPVVSGYAGAGPATADALSAPPALIRGPKQEYVFFRLFQALAREGPVMLHVKELHEPEWERLGGVVFRGKYYHVYRTAA